MGTTVVGAEVFREVDLQEQGQVTTGLHCMAKSSYLAIRLGCGSSQNCCHEVEGTQLHRMSFIWCSLEAGDAALKLYHDISRKFVSLFSWFLNSSSVCFCPVFLISYSDLTPYRLDLAFFFLLLLVKQIGLRFHV